MLQYAEGNYKLGQRWRWRWRAGVGLWSRWNREANQGIARKKLWMFDVWMSFKKGMCLSISPGGGPS